MVLVMGRMLMQKTRFFSQPSASGKLAPFCVEYSREFPTFPICAFAAGFSVSAMEFLVGLRGSVPHLPVKTPPGLQGW